MQFVKCKPEHHQKLYKLYQEGSRKYTIAFDVFTKEEKRYESTLDGISYVHLKEDSCQALIRFYNHVLFPAVKKNIFIEARPAYQNNSLLKPIQFLMKQVPFGGRKLSAMAFEGMDWKITIYHQLGLQEVSRMWRSSVNLKVQLPRNQEIVYRVASLAELLHECSESERHKRLRELYDVEVAITQAIPSKSPWPIMPFEDFCSFFASASFVEEACFYALDGGRIIGQSTVSAKDEHSARVLLTGTTTAYLKQGIATHLKLKSMHTLKQKGFSILYTMNDSANEPMLKLNKKLGFVREGLAKIMFEAL